MTKKGYVRPCIMVENINSAELICASQGGVTSDVGINYGGIDEEGTITVESRRNSVWDDDEEDWN